MFQQMQALAQKQVDNILWRILVMIYHPFVLVSLSFFLSDILSKHSHHVHQYLFKFYKYDLFIIYYKANFVILHF